MGFLPSESSWLDSGVCGRAQPLARLGISWMSAAVLEPSEKGVRLMVSGEGAERPTGVSESFHHFRHS